MHHRNTNRHNARFIHALPRCNRALMRFPQRIRRNLNIVNRTLLLPDMYSKFRRNPRNSQQNRYSLTNRNIVRRYQVNLRYDLRRHLIKGRHSRRVENHITYAPVHLVARYPSIFARDFHVQPRRLIAPFRVLEPHNFQGRTNPLVVNVQRLHISKGHLTSQRVSSRIEPRHLAISTDRRRLHVRISILRRANKLRGITRLHLSPDTTSLIITRYHQRQTHLAIRPHLLLARPFRLLTRRTRLIFTPLLSIQSLLLRLVRVLLREDRHQRRLTLLYRHFFLLFPTPRPVNLNPLTLALRPRLFHLLHLDGLKFHRQRLLRGSLKLNLNLDRLNNGPHVIILRNLTKSPRHIRLKNLHRTNKNLTARFTRHRSNNRARRHRRHGSRRVGRFVRRICCCASSHKQADTTLVDRPIKGSPSQPPAISHQPPHHPQPPPTTHGNSSNHRPTSPAQPSVPGSQQESKSTRQYGARRPPPSTQPRKPTPQRTTTTQKSSPYLHHGPTWPAFHPTQAFLAAHVVCPLKM